MVYGRPILEGSYTGEAVLVYERGQDDKKKTVGGYPAVFRYFCNCSAWIASGEMPVIWAIKSTEHSEASIFLA